jgi:hypothetical protein
LVFEGLDVFEILAGHEVRFADEALVAAGGQT